VRIPSITALCLSFLLIDVGHAACDDVAEAVLANQVGFDPVGSKRAIVVSENAKPVSWVLIGTEGVALEEGSTAVFGDDALSGQHVHRIDFSDFEKIGDGYRVRVGCTESHPFDIDAETYRPLAYDALAYFYHNRAGIRIDERFAGGEQWARPAGHTNEVVSCRSGEDRHGNTWPGCDYTLDVTGGWYDAGDHGKYVVNGGISVWTLLNLYESISAFGWSDAFSDGQVSIPEAGNAVNDLLDEARYELEFLLRMQVPEGATAEVPVGIKRNGPDIEFTEIDASGMAHHKVSDERWTPLPLAPHEDTEKRVLFPVSTAATLNLAAVAAQCARTWRDVDDAFADLCLRAAKLGFAAAVRNPDVYFIADFEGSGMYGDGNLDDEFFWAAAELFITTGERAYLKQIDSSPYFTAPIDGEQGWPRVAPLGLISLAVAENNLGADEIRRVRDMIVAAATAFRDERNAVGYYIPFGADRYAWGSNSNILNRAIILALAYEFSGEAGFRNAAIDAMDYILGRNPIDQSYISGYGHRPMKNPHHRYWAPSFDADMPPPPPGALSGGPNSTAPADEVAREIIGKCAPQTCWRDDVRAYSLNEVAINWNAPLVWVSHFLSQPVTDR
jgi:endoglucanase